MNEDEEMRMKCPHNDVEIEDVQPDSESGVCLDCGMTIIYTYDEGFGF